MNRIVFRWSVWGNSACVDAMLSHSIGSFRRFFGNEPRYVVCADDPASVRQRLRVPAEIIAANDYAGGAFRETASTWRKWSPACRLEPDAIEFYVDADMFLLREPTEVIRFCERPASFRFLCTSEPFLTGYYGNFAGMVNPSLPSINAGLIGQQCGADLTADLMAQYHWWRCHVHVDSADYHDEQGAVRMALEPYLRAGEVATLSTERYRVVCPLNDPPVASLDGIVLLHATFPDHPAFWQFYDEISAVSGLD